MLPHFEFLTIGTTGRLSIRYPSPNPSSNVSHLRSVVMSPHHIRSSSRSSLSPNASDTPRSAVRQRSYSPNLSHHHHSHNSSHKRGQHDPPRTIILPNNAKPIDKREFRAYKPMLALYLEVQKQLDINELPESEVRGRFKSFVRKW